MDPTGSRIEGTTSEFNPLGSDNALTGTQIPLLSLANSECAMQVTTHTSDIDGAGTTARVCMELSGTAGSSGRAELIRPSSITQNAQVTEAAAASSSHSGNGFGRGECADFFISCAALDDLQQLDVWHDSSGEQPAWHLAYVEVTEVRSSKVSLEYDDSFGSMPPT